MIRNPIAKQKNVAMMYLWSRLRIWLISLTTGLSYLWMKGQRLRILMSPIKNTLKSSCIWCIWWCVTSSWTINTWWSLSHTFSSMLCILLASHDSSIFNRSSCFSKVLRKALISLLMLHIFCLRIVYSFSSTLYVSRGSLLHSCEFFSCVFNSLTTPAIILVIHVLLQRASCGATFLRKEVSPCIHKT